MYFAVDLSWPLGKREPAIIYCTVEVKIQKEHTQSTATVVERAHFTRTVWKEKQQATHNEIHGTHRERRWSRDFFPSLAIPILFVLCVFFSRFKCAHSLKVNIVQGRMVFLFLHLQWQLFNITFLGGIWTISMPVALIAVFIVILLCTVEACILEINTHTHHITIFLSFHTWNKKIYSFFWQHLSRG